MLFNFFYLLIAFVLWVVFIPLLLFKSKSKKYKDSIPARFFLKNNPSFEKKLIHFHSASLGETKALKPILDTLNTEVNLTTTTNTGYEEAKKLSSNVRFLPYDMFIPLWYKPQKALVVLEAELWYMLFYIAKKRGAKTILLNARMSDNSFKNYKRFSFIFKKIFANIDYVFAQKELDAKRLKELGAKEVKVIGNIKAIGDFKTSKTYKKPKKPIMTMASSHHDEEELLLKHLDFKDFNLVVVPRHPERFDEVEKLLQNYAKQNSLTYSRFSKSKNFDSDITLVDMMGELINIYAISDTVLLCGSFVDNIGGHNPLEPAYFGCKIISGKYYFNQKALFEIVENLKVCDDISKLSIMIKDLKPCTYQKEVDIEPFLKVLDL